jgi:GH18 family chitinase
MKSKVNVLLTVGGAGRSSGFAHASSTKQNRIDLVNTLIDIVKKYELDGIDFDWEAPQSQVHIREPCFNSSFLLLLNHVCYFCGCTV